MQASTQLWNEAERPVLAVVHASGVQYPAQLYADDHNSTCIITLPGEVHCRYTCFEHSIMSTVPKSTLLESGSEGQGEACRQPQPMAFNLVDPLQVGSSKVKTCHALSAGEPVLSVQVKVMPNLCTCCK